MIIGDYNIWLPVTEVATRNTRFLNPAIDITLTIPSTAKNVITVGGYNSLVNSVSDFSGRGFTRKYQMVKPDIAAPAYQIVTTNTSNGYSPQTGTSVAAPFVTGSCAVLMEWGIVRGNDLFMYGEKIKAYLRLGANRLDNLNYPNREWGFGSLCLAGTFNNLRLPPVISAMQSDMGMTPQEIERLIVTNDYIEFVVRLNAFTRKYIKDDPKILYCKYFGDYAIIYINKNDVSGYTNEPIRTYVSEPFLLGLMDTSALEASGILNLQTPNSLGLLGQGTLVAIIDTGIDYTNEAFIYEDGTSKIYSIWDQTIEGNATDELCFGTEFVNEQINEALASENPLDVVPVTDEIGHGTFLASVSAGRILPR